jgi:FtsZ-binding cell division protein ZapB
MQCHPNKVNSSFIILQHTKFTHGNTAELILRCSEGHLCCYSSTSENIDHYRKKIQQNSSVENEYISKINELNEKNNCLQKEIENLKNKNVDLEPSAPLVEAVIIPPYTTFS